MISIELREAWASDPVDPLPDYPLGGGTVTMDTTLCRPPGTDSGSASYTQLEDAIAHLVTLPSGYTAFAFVIPDSSPTEERNACPGPDDRLEDCGFDVVEKVELGWHSFVANELLERGELERFGPLTKFGLFSTPESAETLADRFANENGRPVVVRVLRLSRHALPEEGP